MASKGGVVGGSSDEGWEDVLAFGVKRVVVELPPCVPKRLKEGVGCHGIGWLNLYLKPFSMVANVHDWLGEQRCGHDEHVVDAFGREPVVACPYLGWPRGPGEGQDSSDVA